MLKLTEYFVSTLVCHFRPSKAENDRQSNKKAVNGDCLLCRQIPDLVRVSRVVSRLLDHAELERSLSAALEQIWVHVADLGVLIDWVAPDQLVDLVDLPLLRVFAAGGLNLDHDVNARIDIVAAV